MVFPNPLASGMVPILSSLLFTGSGGGNYCTLGQPAALTSVLTPTSEFTIIVRTARTAANSTGILIAKADESNNSFSMQSLGGSSATCSIGGNSFNTGTGSIGEPTWNCIGMVNRNAGGSSFMSRCILDSAASSTEVATGTQTSTRDIMIGARRNATNSDAAGWYSGNIGTIAIYNVALTDAQIHYIMGYLNANQMINGLYGPSAGLIAFYPCNEGSGTTLHDCVQGLDGTLTSNVFSSAQYPKPAMVGVGDSLMDGDGGGVSCVNSIKTGGSGLRNGRSTFSYAFPGMNNAYVLSQIQLPSFAPFLNWTMLMWPGVHDLGNIASTVNFINTVVGMLPHNRWLVIGQKPKGVGTSGVGDPTSAGPDDWGTAERIQYDQLNFAIQAMCGQRWYNHQNRILTLANLPTDANDVLQQRMPVPVCADAIHELQPSYNLIATDLDALANSFGY